MQFSKQGTKSFLLCSPIENFKLLCNYREESSISLKALHEGNKFLRNSYFSEINSDMPVSEYKEKFVRFPTYTSSIRAPQLNIAPPMALYEDAMNPFKSSLREEATPLERNLDSNVTSKPAGARSRPNGEIPYVFSWELLEKHAKVDASGP